MRCIYCDRVLQEEMQSYIVNDIGLELTAALEELLNHEINHDGSLCSDCFNIVVNHLSQGTSMLHVTASRCVWCLESITGRRTHSLPESPERDFIAQRILPRCLEPGSRVCIGCWLAARRNILRQHNSQGTSSAIQTENLPIPVDESQPSTFNVMSVCVWCQRSTAGRHTHSLPEGPERDDIATRISPRLVEPSSRVCYACWLAARRNVQRNVPTAMDNSVTSIRLPNFKRAGNTSSRCFVRGCTNLDRHRVPRYLKYKLLKWHKMYVPENARVCNEHLGTYDWEFLEDNIYGQNFSATEIEDITIIAFLHEDNNILDFENIETMSNEMCHYWTGLNISNFHLVMEQTPGLGSFKRSKNALAIFLVKLRTGEPNVRLATLFNMPESSISYTLRKVRDILHQQFVPIHLGVGHLPRNDIVNHNLMIPEGLFGGVEDGRRKAIVICDGTYVYLQKSSNYSFQKKSYSLHKYRNLIKPFVIVAPDGHILDLCGPYPATMSDAEIMRLLFSNENSELRQYFREGDVFILDRGFRDCIEMLTELNYTVCKPESLVSGETQLATYRANKSRHVTLCRWVVEIVNGRFKRDFKIIRNDFSNNAATHLMMDFKIAGAIINAFHVPLTDRPDAQAILERALQKLNEPNVLSDYVLENNLNRRRASFVNIDAGVSLLDEFPVMMMSDLVLFALGTYQIKQARSYFGEHIRENGTFIVQVCDAEQIHIPNIADARLIRGRIKSRHIGSKTYYTYIVLNMAYNNWEQKISGHYCTCIVGKRTVGCCAHIMTIIWYMGWARHQENITAPATFLDNILIVRDDVENEETE